MGVPRQGRCAAVVGLVAAASVLVLASVGIRRSYEVDAGLTVALFVRAPLLRPLRDQFFLNNPPYFAFLENLVGRVMGTSEAAMRILPALCGAGLAGLVGWWSARRWGAASGVVAAALVVSNPLLLAASRDARGYAMAYVLAALASILVLRILDGDEGRGTSLAYVACMGGAIGTHPTLYAVLGLHAGLVVLRGRVALPWVLRLLAAALFGVVPYALAVDSLFQAAPPSPPTPGFAATLTVQLLGGTAAAAVLVVPAVVVGARRWRPPLEVALGGAVLLAYVAVIWVGPVQRGARYCGWMVPVVAVCAARAARGTRDGQWSRWLLTGAACASAVVALVAQIPHLTTDPTPARAMSRLVAPDVAAGRTVCALGTNVTDILVYGTYPFASSLDELRRCDIVLVVSPVSERSLYALARPLFRRQDVVPAVIPGVILRDRIG